MKAGSLKSPCLSKKVPGFKSVAYPGGESEDEPGIGRAGCLRLKIQGKGWLGAKPGKSSMDLDEFCIRFHAFLQKNPEGPQIFEIGTQLLGELLGDARWFGKVLQKLVSDPVFLSTQAPSVFSNEVILHRSPDRSFSVLAYLWEPRTLCAIHDHSSWGIIGSLLHPMREVRYRRSDDGKAEDYAELEEISSRVIKPGEMNRVLPLEKGIHQTGSASEEFAVSLGVYGRSMRKGYILLFNRSEKTVTRAYPPKLYKQILAVRTLKSNSDLWAKEFSDASNSGSLPFSLAEEP
jgi:predicted metal-dependent enzyme (double-stranded beta helix superfamily)